MLSFVVCLFSLLPVVWIKHALYYITFLELTWVESWMLTECVLWLGDSNYPSSSVLSLTDWCMSSPSLFRDRLNMRFALYR